MAYKWPNPQAWLMSKVDEWGVSDLRGALRCLIVDMEPDTVEDAFQSEMEMDGYYGEEVKPEVNLLAFLTRDGCLIGATENFEQGTERKFWNENYATVADPWDPDETEIVEIIVPSDIAEMARVHGTTEQEFSDGYQGWDVIRKNGRVLRQIT